MKTYKCTNPEVGALIHAYELGILDSANDLLFETHLLECDHCFNEIGEFEVKSRYLHSGRLVRNEIKNQVVLGDNIPVPYHRRLWQYIWPNAPFIFRPAILFLLLIVLLYPAYRGMRSLDDSEIGPVQAISLMPDRSNTTKVLSASSKRDGLISFVVPSAVPGDIYHLEIVSTDGYILASDPTFSGFDIYKIGRLHIPVGAMKPGEYQLKIGDPRGDTILSSGMFVFVIEK